MNLLTNGNFNGGWTRNTHTGQEFGEIFVPEGWTAYWDESKGRPEMRVISFEPPYLDPPRVCELPKAVQWFTFYRDHQAGIYQRVTGLQPGARYCFSAQVHAWYSQRDNPNLSEYQDDDGYWNRIENGDRGMTFYLAVDLDGNNNPWINSPTENFARIYNAFSELALEFVATGDAVTVVIESATLYPFKHCDAYVDDAQLVLIEPAPQPVVCRGLPRAPYARKVNVIPATATDERAVEIFLAGWRRSRETAGGSYDDAGIGDLDERHAVLWDIPTAEQQAYRDFFDTYYPEVDVAFDGDSGTIPPPPPPTPINKMPFVQRGIKIAWHTIGGQGQEALFGTLAAQGCPPPTVKFVVDVGPAAMIKQIAPNTKIIGRMIDVDYNGTRYNAEWFNYIGDPIGQANARMELLRATMLANPAVDFWEITNEQIPPTPAYTSAIAIFYARAMTIAESWGKRLALFSFSTGTPEPAAWDYVPVGVYQQAGAGGHAISLHEYGLWPRDANSHFLRFKVLYDNILIPDGIRIPLYITEYGVPREDWDATDKPQQFAAYDAELAKLWYVAGAHIYVNPWDSPYSSYPQYYPQYQQYAVSVKDRVNG